MGSRQRGGEHPLSVAYLFPGQGGQTAGFLHRLPQHPVVDATLDEAASVLGMDIGTLDTSSALASTIAPVVGKPFAS